MGRVVTQKQFLWFLISDNALNNAEPLLIRRMFMGERPLDTMNLEAFEIFD